MPLFDEPMPECELSPAQQQAREHDRKLARDRQSLCRERKRARGHNAASSGTSTPSVTLITPDVTQLATPVTTHEPGVTLSLEGRIVIRVLHQLAASGDAWGRVDAEREVRAALAREGVHVLNAGAFIDAALAQNELNRLEPCEYVSIPRAALNALLGIDK